MKKWIPHICRCKFFNIILLITDSWLLGTDGWTWIPPRPHPGSLGSHILPPPGLHHHSGAHGCIQPGLDGCVGAGLYCGIECCPGYYIGWVGSGSDGSGYNDSGFGGYIDSDESCFGGYIDSDDSGFDGYIDSGSESYAGSAGPLYPDIVGGYGLIARF